MNAKKRAPSARKRILDAVAGKHTAKIRAAAIDLCVAAIVYAEEESSTVREDALLLELVGNACDFARAVREAGK